MAAGSRPGIDYTVRDYAGYREALLAYGRALLPEWKADNEGDFGVVLVELMSYLGDVMSYYLDRVSDEAYLASAQERTSVLELSRTLGYVPVGFQASSGRVTFSNSGTVAVLVPAGTLLATAYLPDSDRYLFFETVIDITVPAADAGTPGQADVMVVHGRTQTGVLGLSDGTVFQELFIPDYPVVEPANTGLPGSPVSVYQIVEDEVASFEVPWNRVEHLLLAGQDDNSYMTYLDANNHMIIRFGDGITGAVPARNQPIHSRYRIGGGVIGNIAANLVVEIVDRSTFPETLDIVESSPMTGGRDPETLDEIRRNAMRAWRSQDRAVSVQDFRNLALRVTGVLKANAFALNYSSVNLYISTRQSTDEEALLPDVVERLTQYMADRVILGTTVSILPAKFIPVYLGATWITDGSVTNKALTVYADPSFDSTDVQTRVVAALHTQFSYEKVDFGQTVSVSEIQHTIMGVPGVQFVTLPQVTWENGPTDGANTVRLKYDQIPYLHTVNITTVQGVTA